MSENELPPIGSRVRVTYEGTVVKHITGAIELDAPTWCAQDGATIEVLAPPLPPEPEGDVVVLDRMGGLWRYEKGAWRHWAHRPRGWAELVAAFGPVTVYRGES